MRPTGSGSAQAAGEKGQAKDLSSPSPQNWEKEAARLDTIGPQPPRPRGRGTQPRAGALAALTAPSLAALGGKRQSRELGARRGGGGWHSAALRGTPGENGEEQGARQGAAPPP